MCRIIVSRPELWDTQFCNGIAGVLPPLERLSLPDAADRVVWTGGDATPSRIGVVDWSGRVGSVVDVEPFWAVLEAQVLESACDTDEDGEPAAGTAAGDGGCTPRSAVKTAAGNEGVDEDLDVDLNAILISLAELITFMALAAARAEAWEQKVVVYVGDNTNVIGWLNSRASNNRYARFMLRLLVRLEAHYKFQTVGVYIRTGYNEFADDLTRLPYAKARKLLAEWGITEVDLLPAWRSYNPILIGLPIAYG